MTSNQLTRQSVRGPSLIHSCTVLIFGDPNDGDPVGTIPSSKVKIICHDGDNICDGGILVLPAHLNYQEDAQTAAEWVASIV